MSDIGKFDAGDVLTVAGLVVTSIGAGIGAAMAWFKNSNNLRDKTTCELRTDMETRMERYEEIRAVHATEIAVLKTSQENIDSKLDELKEHIQNTAIAGAHSVNTQMAQMLTLVQEIKAKQDRRS